MLKTKEITITAEGRDNGKTFIITEKPAMQAEQWAARAFNGLARADVEIPDSVVGAGIVGIFVIGVKMLFAMDWPVAKELMDEMLSCVEYQHPGSPIKIPLVGPMAMQQDVVEEVTTLILLREEVFRLHTGFTLAEVVSKLTSANQPAGSPNTETSPA